MHEIVCGPRCGQAPNNAIDKGVQVSLSLTPRDKTFAELGRLPNDTQKASFYIENLDFSLKIILFVSNLLHFEFLLIEFGKRFGAGGKAGVSQN